MRVRTIAIALLLFYFIVGTAGAIYIEGQEIPNDGLVHIMSADTGTADPTMVPLGASTAGLFPQGFAGSMFGGFPAQMPGLVPPAMPGVSGRTISVPSISMPAPDAEGNIVIGDTIGHIVPPATPGYWDNIPGKDLHTNMPVIGL